MDIPLQGVMEMGYRVEYGKPSRRYEKEGGAGIRVALMTLCFAGIFGFLTVKFWPDGAKVLDRLFSLEDWAVTRHALETMATELRAGLPVGDAVTAFCREIISEGLAYVQ